MHDNRIDLIRPDAPELAQLGPHAVGVRTLSLVNPAQVDVLQGGRSDRRIDVELWYPAVLGTLPGGTYSTLCRDGRTEVVLHGQAARDAAAAAGEFPLVILSHGYPGNRMLMGHLGENLASKGYLVASIDHPESTYGDPVYRGGAAFASTLVNRPLDTRFVMDALGSTQVAIIGYSMGGYGALLSAGARVLAQGVELGAIGGVTAVDPRLKAIVPIGPWGRQRGVFDAVGVAVPMLVMAGSLDDVSGYIAMRQIVEEAAGTRHLLTFDGAGHNAAAPCPAPLESWARVDGLEFVPFDHYADKVWDTVRMNNIAQHFVTAFLDVHLKGEAGQARFLSAEFAGFAAGSARGLRFETARPEDGRIAHPTITPGS